LAKYDDFTGNSAFTTDNQNNTIYIKDDKYYIVNDIDKEKKLKDLEGYRYFFYNGSRPPILFVIILVIGVPLGALLQYFYFPNLDQRATPFIIGFPLYLISLFIYKRKINNIIKDCKTVTKDAVSEYILSNEEGKKKIQKISVSSIKSNLPDMNIFHIIIFLIIASPFLYFLFGIFTIP